MGRHRGKNKQQVPVGTNTNDKVDEEITGPIVDAFEKWKNLKGKIGKNEIEGFKEELNITTGLEVDILGHIAESPKFESFTKQQIILAQKIIGKNSNISEKLNEIYESYTMAQMRAFLKRVYEWMDNMVFGYNKKNAEKIKMLDFTGDVLNEILPERCRTAVLNEFIKFVERGKKEKLTRDEWEYSVEFFGKYTKLKELWNITEDESMIFPLLFEDFVDFVQKAKKD
ncbi:Uncharacterized protein QTN25_008341 [Entamoeba marina]